MRESVAPTAARAAAGGVGGGGGGNFVLLGNKSIDSRHRIGTLTNSQGIQKP